MNNEHRTMNKTIRLLNAILGALVSFSLFTSPWPLGYSVAFADVPHLIRYQGQAVDAKGVPLEGPHDLTFRLYDAATGGTAVWTEPHPAVLLAKGYFTVLLGSVTTFPGSLDWSTPLWLAVQVNGEPELSPRQQITSVPLALQSRHAENADAATTAEVAQKLAVPVTTSTITDDVSRLVPSGAIILWTAGNCPTGYSRVSTLDGALLKVGAAHSGPTTMGEAELAPHLHGAGSYVIPDHVHNLWSDAALTVTTQGNGLIGSTYSAAWKTLLMQPAGAGPLTGSSGSAGSGKVATVLLCQKD